MSGSDNSGSIGTAWCLFVGIVLIAIYLLAHPAQSQVSQPRCGLTVEIEKALASQYGESPLGAAILSNGAPVLLFTNEKTGTFTVVVRRPGKVSCIMATGSDWTPVEKAKQGTDL